MRRDANLFVSPEETRRLADGKVYAPAQCRALDRKKVPYIKGERGRPLVAKAWLERKLVGRAMTPEPAQEPDFSVFPAVS